MRILVSCFEPFGDDMQNASALAVHRLPRQLGANEVLQIELPVVFETAGTQLLGAIEFAKPDIVIATGQAGGISGIHLERAALNIMDASHRDNHGKQPRDIPIASDGPAAYFSTLPLRPALETITSAGIPASISNSAGTYVCNDVMYRLLHGLSRQDKACMGGFVHIPYAPQQVAAKGSECPSMPSEMAAEALTLLMQECLRAMTGAPDAL